MSFTETAPDYIPDHIQTLHLDEARHRLRQTPRGAAGPPTMGVANTDPRTDPTDGFAELAPSPARGPRVTTVASALIGVPGAMALTAVWAWLSMTRPSPVWWSLTALGVALTVVGIVSVVRIVAAARAAKSPEPHSAPVDTASLDVAPADPSSIDTLPPFRDAA